MITSNPIELSVTLRPTDAERPCKVRIRVPGDQRILLIDQITKIDFSYEASGQSHVEVALLDQQQQEGVEILSVSFFGIQDPRFAWAGVYVPEYPEPWASEQKMQGVVLQPQLSPHTYLSWPGTWTLTFDTPVFTWIHNLQHLGWIFDPLRSFRDSFCPSPWFHMRITNSGTYEPCRWMNKTAASRVDFDRNIRSMTPQKYFQKHMAPLRSDLLAGKKPYLCADCKVMDQHNKPSGRWRQLLKIGVLEQNFEKSLASSPMRPAFDYSLEHMGDTDRMPSDWQIDLGNYCNGACIYCHPENSSTLAAEFLKLGLIDQPPPTAWCDDPKLLDQFVDVLSQSEHLHYLHFLGGETVITPGFKKILSRLIEVGLAGQVSIGFTTNLTVWDDSVVDLLTKFQQVHLGMSIETLTSINDYVRYPSKQNQTRQYLDRWVALGHQAGWFMQLRITPTCLTIHDLTTVYDYAWDNSLAVESCNFLDRPEFMRISVLPKQLRDQISHGLQTWINDRITIKQEKIINTRNPNLAQVQIVQDAETYVNYLNHAKDESWRLPDLIKYLKLLESSRGNTVLDYLPQYEDLFRSYDY